VSGGRPVSPRDVLLAAAITAAIFLIYAAFPGIWGLSPHVP
jgi:hypothetical protein